MSSAASGRTPSEERTSPPPSVPTRISGFVSRHELAVGLAVALVMAAVSVAITMQGWRSRVTAFDLLTYVYSADQLLESGMLPQHGDTGSYGSFKPPGTAWLMLPSRALTSDPRLAEYAGTGLLHLAVLAGIFLLARRYFGWPTAIISVVAYSISAHGLLLAGSLWPNGRPDFFVLTVLLASQWVAGRESRFLGAALGVWAIGMYVDMGLAPAFAIFPALWLYFRPPVRVLPLVAAGIVILAIWSPYLQFQTTRDFADVRSQLLLQDIFPDNHTSVWCDPSRELHAVTVPGVESGDQDQGSPDAPRGLSNLLPLADALRSKAMSNFSEGTLVPLGDGLLALLVGFSVLVFSVAPAARPGERRRKPPLSRRQLTLAAVGLIAIGLLLHLPIVEMFSDGAGGAASTARRAGFVLGVGGAALLAIPWLAGGLGRYLERRGVNLQTRAQAEARRMLVLSLLVPWVLIVAVAEPGKPERFWWLWPLQIVFASALVFEWLPRVVPRRLVAVVAALLLIAVVVNPMLHARLGSWLTTGWESIDAEEVQVVDYVATHILTDGESAEAIGYQTYIYGFMANSHITNPAYKVGAEFDLLFTYRHGITNRNQCAEGLSEDDAYRIVQTRRRAEPWQPREYFEASLPGGFNLLREFDLYQVWARSEH